MTGLFVVTFDVGGDAPVETVTGLLSDVGALCRASRELAMLMAQDAVDNLIAITREASAGEQAGWVQLMQAVDELVVSEREAKRRALEEIESLERQRSASTGYQGAPSAAELDEYIAARTRQVIWDEAARLARLRQRAGELLSMNVPILITDAHLIVNRLMHGSGGIIDTAYCVSVLVSNQAYRFRSVHYQSPVVLEILSGTGFASASLAYLLKVVRDWSAGQRRALAAAQDAESQLIAKSRLREIMIEQASTGQIALTPEIINSLISGSASQTVEHLADTVKRLATYSPTVDQREIKS